MTQQLTKTDQAGVPSLHVPEETGLHGEFDEGDVALPMCSIVQPTSAEERGEAGTFYFNDGRNVDVIQAVVLNILGTRTLWAPKGKKAEVEGIVCRSSDRRQGITQYPLIVLGLERAKKEGIIENDSMFIPCAECPHFNDDQFRNDDYLCKKGYTLLMVDRETAAPFLFFVKGSAMRIVTRTIVSPCVMRVRRGQPAAPWMMPYEWRSQLVSNDKGKFYVPAIKPLPTLSEVETNAYGAQAEAMSGRAVEQMEEEDLGELEDEPEQARFEE